MIRGQARVYADSVIPSARRQGGMLLFAFALTMCLSARAQAGPMQLPAVAAPVVYVRLLQGNVIVRTWNRQVVQVEGDPSVEARSLPPRVVANRLPKQMMLWSQTLVTKDGARLTLPAEPFPFPNLDQTPHDGVVIHGKGNATITIPANTALLVTVVRKGSIAIDGFRNGTFAALMGGGKITLDRVSGTGAVQLNYGPFIARDSTFDRIRVRTGRGNMFFERCTSAQIQATSLLGTIVYDDGSFTPGLAHFESQRGNIALGVNGDALVNAHSDAGRIFTSGDVPIARGANDAQATYARGGPVVTATSARGSVIFYRGSLRMHPQLQQRFNLRRPPARPRPSRRPPRLP